MYVRHPFSHEIWSELMKDSRRLKKQKKIRKFKKHVPSVPRSAKKQQVVTPVVVFEQKSTFPFYIFIPATLAILFLISVGINMYIKGELRKNPVLPKNTTPKLSAYPLLKKDLAPDI